MLATLDRGDTVLVPNPATRSTSTARSSPAPTSASVRMTSGVDFFAELERPSAETNPKPKMLILGFPCNPTASASSCRSSSGGRAGARARHPRRARPRLRRHRLRRLPAPSIMQVPGARDVAVEFFTMSKSYNMAGWRIGFMVGNRDLVAALARIKSYHDYGTFTPIQVAAIAALEGPQDCVEEIRENYQRGATCWSRACTRPAGWSTTPRPRCTSGPKIPEPYARMGSLEFAKKLLARRRWRSRPASASASMATTTCASR
jgi:alanine-synthesizing transaminase